MLLGIVMLLTITNIYADDFLFKIIVNRNVINSVARQKLIEYISQKNFDGVTLGEPYINYQNGEVEIIMDITRTEKSFLGDVTISGELTSTWRIVLKNDLIVIKRGKLQFKNKNKTFSLLDNVISGLAENFLPEEIPFPKSWIEKELINAATTVDFLQLKFQSLNLTLNNVKQEADFVEIDISGSGILASNDIDKLSQPKSGLVFSKNWLTNMMTLQLKPNKQIEINNFSLEFKDKKWIAHSDAVYHFKWLWLIPDDIKRKIDVSLTPEVEDNSLHLKLNDVSAYSNKPSEFSLFNWYIEGKIKDTFIKYEYPLKAIPTTFHSIAGDYDIIGSIVRLNITQINTVDDRVFLSPTLEMNLSIELKK